MEINDSFRVSTPIDATWKVMLDIEGIAPCLPGAQLQEIDGDEYRGGQHDNAGVADAICGRHAAHEQFHLRDGFARGELSLAKPQHELEQLAYILAARRGTFRSLCRRLRVVHFSHAPRSIWPITHSRAAPRRALPHRFHQGDRVRLPTWRRRWSRGCSR